MALYGGWRLYRDLREKYGLDAALREKLIVRKRNIQEELRGYVKMNFNDLRNRDKERAYSHKLPYERRARILGGDNPYENEEAKIHRQFEQDCRVAVTSALDRSSLSDRTWTALFEHAWQDAWQEEPAEDHYPVILALEELTDLVRIILGEG